jgi:AraC-like DNA-binding protein
MAIFGIHDLFLLLNIVFGMCLGGLSILSGSKNRVSSSFMATFFVALATASLCRLVFSTPYFSDFIHEYSQSLTFLYVLACLVVGPALYLYVRSLANPGFTLSYLHSLHFIVPALVALGVLFSRGSVGHIIRTADPDSLLLYWAVAILTTAPIGYTILAWSEVQKTKQALNNFYSSALDAGSKWLTLLVSGYFLVLLSTLAIHFLSTLSQYNSGGLPNCVHSTIDMLTLGLLFVLFFYSWTAESRRLAQVLRGEVLPDSIDVSEAISREHPRGDLADNHFITAELPRLNRAIVLLGIVDKKLYLDPSLNIERFAQRIDLKTKDVSFYINTQLKCNFFEFINTYRVQEAQRLLIEEREASVNEIMRRSGFTSTSSFFRAFKKITGVSPNQFRSSPPMVQNA